MSATEIVASIIGVAGAGFRLSLILNAISCEIANAPLEIHHISKTVTLFSSMLNQTGAALKAADAIHSQEAIKTAEQIANDSAQVFAEVNDMIDRCRTKRPDGSFTPSIQQRFKWTFKKNRINYLLAQLESLKLSLSLMLQIVQLGKIMAATSKTDPPEVVEVKKDEISRERLDVQNIIIVRYMQNEQVDRLFQACEPNETQSLIDSPSSPASETSSVLTIEPPPEYSASTSLSRLPLYSLGEIDQMMQGIRNSPRDMVQVSDKVIDPLLDKWTRWHQVREERHAQQANPKYVPHVDSLQGDDEDIPLHQRYPDRDESPRGYYLEGVTTNWREPHSVAARQELASKKKQYVSYQPSVSAVSSDREHSPGSNTSRKRQAKRHVISSSPESSDSEFEKTHGRKDSGFGGQDRRHPQEPISADRTQPRNAQPNPQIPLAHVMSSPLDNRSNLSPHYMPQTQHRPYPAPEQGSQHSYTMPLPPLYTHHMTHPTEKSSTSPGYPQPPYHGQPSGQAPRQYQQQYPTNRGQPTSPVIRDGRRSPSRFSQDSSRSYHRPRERRNSRDEKRMSRDKKARNLTDGAAKGLLGAGAIAGFLEALEGLSL